MKKIIILGGGFAGAYCARNLEKDFEVTLIDTKDYFEFTPSVLRTIVEPEHISKIQVLHRQYLHRASIIKEEVKSITPTAVRIKSASLPYDYLILCSGSTYNTPIKEKNLVLTSRAEELQEYAQHLKDAVTVLIIGGGLVGVELAAEIILAYPSKSITLVHAKSELMERNPAKAREYARTFLEQRGVKIMFNERVVSFGKKGYVTDKGNILTADLTFLCTGIKPNYEYMEKYCSTSLNERQNICVNPFLQVQGYQHIFAAGDITNIPEEKTAQNSEQQAEVVVRNIYHLERNESPDEYHSQPRVMVINLGKWDGMLVYKNFVLRGIIPGILKRLIEWKTMRKYKR